MGDGSGVMSAEGEESDVASISGEDGASGWSGPGLRFVG